MRDIRLPHSTERRPAMKIIASGVISLSLTATVASIASAVDAKTFYEQQERSSY